MHDVLAQLLHWIGFGLCHQLPARSFFAGGYEVPVCARDTGIYLGFMTSYLIVVALARGRRPSETPPMAALIVGVVLVALMGIDGVTSYLGLRATSNELRLATGLGAGWAIGLFIVPLLNQEVWKSPGRGRPLDEWLDVAIWLAALPVAYLVVWWVLPLLGVGYPLLVAVAILATFTLVNLVLVGLMLPYERRADRVRDLALPALIGFGLTVVELTGAALLKLWAASAAASIARSRTGR